MNSINPIIAMDYPDPDVIRVDDTYYMVSTTMYFMPGCEILRSYDLVHWEHAAYVYDKLDSTPAQRMAGKENIYGQGMWAASLRYHNGTFYICFVANDTHKTYLYTASSIGGPWKKSEIEGFYHDNSILFDDDGRVYIVYGNKEVYITELNEELTGPKEGGLHRMIVKDSDDVYLGYEGSHFYKINGTYYLFMIHIPKSTGKRTESCFYASSLTDDFVGLDVMDDDRNFRRSGVAQGGIVDTPKGNWYAILFQDSGAVGRIPVLMPVSWSNDTPSIPIFGNNGVIPEEFEIENNRPGYNYAPLYGDDDFKDELATYWQFNHEPDMSLIRHDRGAGTLRITTGKVATNLVQAQNTLTQRCHFPYSKAAVTIDASGLKDGDYAGLCILQSNYSFVGVTRKNAGLYLVLAGHTVVTPGIMGERKDDTPALELFRTKIDSPVVTLFAETKFDDQRTSEPVHAGKSSDRAFFGYDAGNGETMIQPSTSLYFKLDHFTGARFGLFTFSTLKQGGYADFSDFKYFA